MSTEKFEMTSEPLRLHGMEDSTDKRQEKSVMAQHTASKVASLVQRMLKGEIPSNDDIIRFIQNTIEFIDEEDTTPYLDQKAHELLRNAKQLLLSLTHVFQVKNNNQAIQNLLSNSFFSIKELKSSKEVDQMATENNEAISDSSECIKVLANKLMFIGKLAFQEPEFRSLIFKLSNFVEVLLLSVEKEKLESPEAANKEIEKEEVGSDEIPKDSDSEIDKASNKFGKSNRKVKELTGDLRRLLVILSSNESWKHGIRDIFYVLTQIYNRFSSTVDSTMDSTRSYVARSLKDWKTLVENFMNGESLDPFFDSIQSFVKYIRTNKDIYNYLVDLRNFIEMSMANCDYVKSDDFNNHGDHIIKRGRDVSQLVQNNEKLSNLFDEWHRVTRTLKSDQDLVSIQDNMAVLKKSFNTVDSDGRIRLDTHTIWQLKEAMIPLLVDKLAFIPVPHLVYRSEEMDWDIDGVVVNVYDLLPEQIEVDTNSHSGFRTMSRVKQNFIQKVLDGGPIYKDDHPPPGSGMTQTLLKESEREVGFEEDCNAKVNGSFKLQISDFKADVRDVRFSFNRKIFPKHKSEGLVDVHIGGGTKLTVILDLDNSDIEHTLFTSGEVRVQILKIKIHIHNSSHDFMYNSATKLFKRLIRKKIEEAITEKLAAVLGNIISKVNDVFAGTPSLKNKSSLQGSQIFRMILDQVAFKKNGANSGSK